LLQLGKTVIIKEALANGRVFKTKIQPLSKLYQIVDAMAKKYQVAQMLLHSDMSWIIEPTYLLSGASNIEQLEQNIKA
jgi:aryl-alcohol dehydrogenase-like predicted oxidoreductase